MIENRVKLNKVKSKKKKDLYDNRYNPIEIIGQGSYGIVMKCEDKQTNRMVAIKKITDSYLQVPEVLRELTILNKLNKHTNVISLLNIFRVKSYLYIVFPHMDYNMYNFITEYYPNGLGYDLTKKFMIQVRFKTIIKHTETNILFSDYSRY